MSGYLLSVRRYTAGRLAGKYSIRAKGGHNWLAQQKVLHKKLRKLLRSEGNTSQYPAYQGRLFKVIGNRKKELNMCVELQQYF